VKKCKYSWYAFASLTLVGVLALSGCQTARNARLLLPPSMSGMERVAPRLVLEAPVSQAVTLQVIGLQEKIDPPHLETLLSFDDWDAAIGRYGDHLQTHDSDAVTVVYPTAGHEVRRWIDIVGVNGHRRLVDELALGADFSTVYTALEREAK